MRVSDGTVAPGEDPARHATAKPWPLKPQSVIFTLLAEQVLPAPCAVFSGSFIEVLGRLGIGEHATRSTLTRMVGHGLLRRQRAGRKVYFCMTERCMAVLEDGRRRIWVAGAVNDRPAGDFTLLTFSLPEPQRRKRYDLRARLRWEGFGMLQNGVWMAPTEVDVGVLIEELELQGQVRVFRARPTAPTEAAGLVAQTFDLETVEQRYRAFLARWAQADAAVEDSLLLTLRLSTHWLHVIRDDPRVPLDLLPDDWCAIRAQEFFRSLHESHQRRASDCAQALLDTQPVSP